MPIACKARAVADFAVAMQAHPEDVNILLVDSEGPNSVSLLDDRVRKHPNWKATIDSKVSDDQIHFMVQVMESWFLADPGALGGNFGRGFAKGKLPGHPKIEEIDKNDVLAGLKAATRGTGKRRYHKTRHAPELLARVDVAKVRSAAPFCERLFKSLESVSS
jgi:hypothetical protein